MTTRKRKRDIGQDVLEEILVLVSDPRNLGGTEIHRELVNNPKLVGREIPEVRTLQRTAKDIREKLGPLDRLFEWHRLDEYGLPWEASEFLLEMWAYVKELGVALEWALQYSTPLPPPTVRQAHWWWRVHQAAPDQDKVFIQLWAEALWQCELHKDVLGKTVDVSDIEAFLAYREWVSPEHKTIYDQAVKDGRIPPLQTILENLSRLNELRDRPEFSQHFPKPGPEILTERLAERPQQKRSEENAE